MARTESQALAGYYPTPPAMTNSLASLISFDSAGGYNEHHLLLDPAAGDGEAITTLHRTWWPEGSYNPGHIAACELEETRARGLRKRKLTSSDQLLEGDAFALIWPAGSHGASLLFLNPPYDHDPEHGRLEQKFLVRFTAALAPGGALLYIVPVHALSASAKFLATRYSEIRCWRFPEPHYEAFKQVVLVARRLSGPLVDAPMAATIESWAKFPARLIPLPERCTSPLRVSKGPYNLPLHLVPFDRIAALESYKPWQGIAAGVNLSVGDLIGRQYPTAMPPKPAHLALALANGHFNGHRIGPDDPDRDPPLLVKGMFTKELVEVERKLNKEGEVTAIVQVQQPRLQMSALRLDTFEFFEPRPGSEPTNHDIGEQCNTRDIIDRYSRALARLMTQQFPALHNPTRADQQMRLPDLPRKPFRVQYHAIQAALKLLARGENPKFVAEVGTGKTTMALYVWAAMSPRFHARTVEQLVRAGIPDPKLPVVRRMLVLCPPHLLDTWSEEIVGDERKPGVVPWAKFKVVRTIADLHSDAEIYIMSRETAKLGHGYVGISGRCPRCGSPVPEDEETNMSKRLRCNAIVREPWNVWAYLAEELGAALLPAMPKDDLIQTMIRSHRMLRKRATKRARPQKTDLQRIRELMGHLPQQGDSGSGRATMLSELADSLSDKEGTYQSQQLPLAILLALARALGDEIVLAAALDNLVKSAAPSRSQWTPYSYALEAAKTLRMNAKTPVDAEDRTMYFREAMNQLMILAKWSGRPSYQHSRHRIGLRPRIDETKEGEDPSERCNEPLFAAVGQPRRFPLARYICRYMRRRFDMIVLDEAHEFNNLGTAQEKAAHRLSQLHVPVLALTGSIMGGYSSSLFANWWHLDRSFREEFARDEQPSFVRRYGYQKFVVSPREAKGGATFGRQSDRMEDWTTKAAGEVPGVLPLFLLQHLLPSGVVVHKDELDRELPPMDERQVLLPIESDQDEELLQEFSRISNLLISQIKADMYTALSGKLWGAMMELPSYLDRCTVDQGPFELRYPKDAGGMLVAEGKLFPSSYTTPKERALLDFLRSELEQGRRSMVFVRHVSGGLPERLIRLIRQSDITQGVAYLNAQRVAAPVRKEWISSHVVARKVDILITNPNCVRTGLNNLVWFCNAWWHEVDYSAQTYRQANGRLHRVGQESDVKVRFPHYPKTAQEVAVNLVARKVTASLQVDGLSVQGALEAAGSEISGKAAAEAAMVIGRAIYERLIGGAA